MGLTWSILIATHVTRYKTFDRLVRNLTPQLTSDIEVVVYWNRGEYDIGTYRQALLEDAGGEYVSFVDDDDRVPDYFCEEVLTAVESRPDYVGFELKLLDRRPRMVVVGRALHSLEYDGWSATRQAYLRDITHLNPIRRDIAVKGRFDGVRGEDRKWAEMVRPYVHSQVYVDRVMYVYEYNRRMSLRGGERADDKHLRPKLPKRFRFHPDSDR